jgi:AAA+ ATPase superfamily predicted ATPase
MASRAVRFVGREEELAALEERYASPHSELLPIYGRRRVGKTELLIRLAKGKPTVFFTASAKLPVAQIGAFMREAADWLRKPDLAKSVLLDWKTALQQVMRAAPPERKLLLVLDEFQWACDSSPDLPSQIQSLWDHEWQRTGRIMLVLCGSYIGFMEREVLGPSSPLYGRRAGVLKLAPFNFIEAARFHPSWSCEQQARAYFVCGGVPAYLRRFNPDLSVEQNVAREFFRRDAVFQNEPAFLLREELSDVSQAMSILEAVAMGRKAQGEIAKAVGLSSSALAPHLRLLVELGYLERIVPLTPKPPPRTAVVYRMGDPLLRFWFEFVEPRPAALRCYSARRAFELLVAPQWDAFCGDGFERLCREALPYLYEQEAVAGRYSVGEYWQHDSQIDVVGLRADGRVDLGECRWQADVPMARAIKELRARAEKYPAAGRTKGLRVFVRARPRTDPPGVRVHDLQELYALPGSVNGP